METDLTAYLLLFGVGAVAGTVNVIAGGGSFLTLPAMIFLGLPPSVANGTNRIAILIQNAGAVWSFHRHRVLDWRGLPLAALPALAGAGLGTWLALEIGELAFRRILAVLMVVISLWTLWDPLKRREVGEEMRELGTGERAGLVAAFFLVGVYGGFVQAGVGFLILAATTVAGLNLVSGNALKVLIILTFTPLSLALFALGGKVAWGLGLGLAAGNLTGAFLGVRITVRKGHRWVKRAVTVLIVAFALRLWLGG